MGAASQARDGREAGRAPRVGCTACHAKVSPDKDYTLGAEARRLTGHPTSAPDGTPIDDQAKFATCMKCHASTSGERGTAASVSMARMAHPVHMFRSTFKAQLGGTW